MKFPRLLFAALVLAAAFISKPQIARADGCVSLGSTDNWFCSWNGGYGVYYADGYYVEKYDNGEIYQGWQ